MTLGASVVVAVVVGTLGLPMRQYIFKNMAMPADNIEMNENPLQNNPTRIVESGTKGKETQYSPLDET